MARRRRHDASIRPARPADLDRIMEIERLSFAHPWSRQAFVEELERSFSRLEVLLHDRTGEVIAFINYWVVHDEIHVLNVAIHPDWRRRGLASQLMEHAISTGRRTASRLMTLEVRRSNTAAIQLYESLGFEVVDIRRRYYEDREDAIVMVLSL
jgi:ribosomal-protein-alanine N-acetyltransferase